MAYDRMVPQIWSSQLLLALQKNLVYGQPGVINRDYEGEISQAGDTVRINSIGRPTVKAYTPGGTITREQLTDAQRTLVVDRARYFAFDVDDVNARQANIDIVRATMQEAAYAVADDVDQYLAGLYTQVASANNLGTISVTTSAPKDFYDKVLVPLAVKLDEANVRRQGRYCIIPPWLHGRALLDDRLIKVNESGTDTGLRNGVVLRAAGFDLMVSNNTPNPTGDDNVVQAGVSSAITFASQIAKTEAFRPEDSFSDAIKGLYLHGAKVIRPESLAIATVSQT